MPLLSDFISQTSTSTPIPDWATLTVYAAGNYVNQSNKLYKCIAGHTAGTFSTDLDNDNWVEVSSSDGGVTNVGTFSPNANANNTSVNFGTAPTFTSNGGRVVVFWSGAIRAGTVNTVNVVITVDGGNSRSFQVLPPVANQDFQTSGVVGITGLSAGSHTIGIAAQDSSTTSTIATTSRWSFTVIEL